MQWAYRFGYFFCQTVGEKSRAEHVLYLDELVSDEQEGGGEKEEGRDQEAVHEGIIHSRILILWDKKMTARYFSSLLSFVDKNRVGYLDILILFKTTNWFKMSKAQN